MDEIHPGVQILQKTLEINTQSMDQLRVILFKDIATIRISDAFTQPEMATDLFEHDLKKLNILWQRGRGVVREAGDRAQRVSLVMWCRHADLRGSTRNMGTSGQTVEFTGTYEMFKTVLHSQRARRTTARYRSTRSCKARTRNATNIYADGDVDIVIWTDSVYYSELSNLNEEEMARFDKTNSVAKYQWADFRRDVVSWLTTKYESAVDPGGKAIFVSGYGSLVGMLTCS